MFSCFCCVKPADGSNDPAALKGVLGQHMDSAILAPSVQHCYSEPLPLTPYSDDGDGDQRKPPLTLALVQQQQKALWVPGQDSGSLGGSTAHQVSRPLSHSFTSPSSCEDTSTPTIARSRSNAVTFALSPASQQELVNVSAPLQTRDLRERSSGGVQHTPTLSRLSSRSSPFDLPPMSPPRVSSQGVITTPIVRSTSGRVQPAQPRTSLRSSNQGHRGRRQSLGVEEDWVLPMPRPGGLQEVGSFTGSENQYADSFDMAPSEIDDQQILSRCGPLDVATMLGQASQDLINHEVTIEKVLARGSCGLVFLGEWRNLPVAVKAITMRDDATDPDTCQKERTMLTAAVGKTLTHPNLVATHTIVVQVAEPSVASLDFTDEIRMYIVKEYCDSGTLAEAVDCGWLLGGPLRRPDMASIMSTAMDIACGLSHMHSQNMVHGNLGSHNVMLQVHNKAAWSRIAKVTDWGSLKALADIEGQHQATNNSSGTNVYAAPEVSLLGETPTRAADSYAFGVILWEMYHGKPPWRGRKEKSTGPIKSSPMVLSRDGYFAIDDDCPLPYADLIRDCLQGDPTARPTFFNIIQRLIAYLKELYVDRDQVYIHSMGTLKLTRKSSRAAEEDELMRAWREAMEAAKRGSGGLLRRFSTSDLRHPVGPSISFQDATEQSQHHLGGVGGGPLDPLTGAGSGLGSPHFGSAHHLGAGSGGGSGSSLAPSNHDDPSRGPSYDGQQRWSYGVAPNLMASTPGGGLTRMCSVPVEAYSYQKGSPVGSHLMGGGGGSGGLNRGGGGHHLGDPGRTGSAPGNNSATHSNSMLSFHTALAQVAAASAAQTAAHAAALFDAAENNVSHRSATASSQLGGGERRATAVVEGQVAGPSGSREEPLPPGPGSQAPGPSSDAAAATSATLLLLTKPPPALQLGQGAQVGGGWPDSQTAYMASVCEDAVSPSGYSFEVPAELDERRGISASQAVLLALGSPRAATWGLHRRNTGGSGSGGLLSPSNSVSEIGVCSERGSDGSRSSAGAPSFSGRGSGALEDVQEEGVALRRPLTAETATAASFSSGQRNAGSGSSGFALGRRRQGSVGSSGTPPNIALRQILQQHSWTQRCSPVLAPATAVRALSRQSSQSGTSPAAPSGASAEQERPPLLASALLLAGRLGEVGS